MSRPGSGRRGGSRRLFDYDRRLLPNAYLAELDPHGIEDPRSSVEVTGLTIGYPAWNLLYYSLLCSIVPEVKDVVVVETGTNEGISTIVMAQALRDLGRDANVLTVDTDEEAVEIARKNVRLAGLEDYVEFHVRDSLEFLGELIERIDHIDFAFLDSAHDFDHVIKEAELIHSKVAARGGKVYFDNTVAGGVGDALDAIEQRYGFVLRFDNCSWGPPGNAIWQPR
jgi:predicted O-methyltransferase YrrM